MENYLPDDIYKQIGDLEDKNDDELYEILGAFALSQNPNQLHENIAIDAKFNTENLTLAAKKFMEEMEPVIKEAICGPDGIAEYIELPTVRDVLALLLPALGISTSSFVPIAIIALCIILIRAGIREYCNSSD